MEKEKTKRGNFPTQLILITLVIGLIVVLGYFFLNRNTQEVQDSEENNAEVEKMIETNAEEVVVIFEDEILENHIREELGIPTGDITSTDMLELYYITISKLGVTNLTGLEYALELIEFSLLRENVESLEPLKNLNNLERLSLHYNVIENLPIQFSKDVNLNHVSIVNTPIEDASFLSHMTNVEHLTMTDASLEDISSVKNLTNVTQLNVRGNEIKDISALEGKDNLEILNLQSNEVSDVSSLTGLKKLYDLVLSFNPIYNLKPLETLPSLRVLVVHLDHDVKHLIFDQVKVFESAGIEVQYTR